MIFSEYQWTLIASVVAVATFLYYYLNRNFKYWESLNISGPKPIPFFGNMFSMFLKPKADVEMEWYRKYGKIYGVYNFNTPALTVADPELIKQILVKDFHSFRNRRDNPSGSEITSKSMVFAVDDDWKRIRAIATPTFTSGKLKKMYSVINECCDEFIESLDEFAKNKKDIDLKKLHGAYTMDVIASCAFATKTNTHKDPDNPFTKNAFAIFNMSLWKVVAQASLPRFIQKIKALRKIIANDELNKIFINVVKHVMKQRRDNNEKRNDFLQLLMDVEISDNKPREESDAFEAHHVNEGEDEVSADAKALSNVIEKKLTENEVLAQCLVFFLAGYETTATTLSFCSYELALHPEIQERLYEEIKTVFDENGKINYETLSKLPFLDSVLSETLRLHNPAMRLGRKAMEDVVLGNTGITIKKGMMAEVPIHAIHHDPENYENPYVFSPDRFMPENRDKIKPYTYLPFGAGPRNCIGMRFALLEAKLALAKIAHKFRFSRSPKTDVPLILNKGRILMQAKSLIVRIERR